LHTILQNLQLMKMMWGHFTPTSSVKLKLQAFMCMSWNIRKIKPALIEDPTRRKRSIFPFQSYFFMQLKFFGKAQNWKNVYPEYQERDLKVIKNCGSSGKKSLLKRVGGMFALVKHHHENWLILTVDILFPNWTY